MKTLKTGSDFHGWGDGWDDDWGDDWDDQRCKGLSALDCSWIPGAGLPCGVKELVVRPVYNELRKDIEEVASSHGGAAQGWVAYISGNPGIGM